MFDLQKSFIQDYWVYALTEDKSVVVYGCFHPNYAEEIEYFKQCKVYSVQIESTLQCQQCCLYCYASDENAPMKELSKEQTLSVLDSAAKMEVRAIDWLGGDPLLRKDWYDLMKYAINRGLKNNVWTSGLPLADIEIAKKVVEVTEGGFVSVHLDSLNEDVYKKLHTGEAQKNIETILKGVDNMQSLGKKPENMMNCITLTKQVAGEDVKSTINFFFEKKGMRTCLTQMCEAGLAKEHSEWIPTIQEIREACDSRDMSNYSKLQPSMSTMDVNKFYCGGMICVTVNGDVTPCSVIRKGFGNIYEKSLEKIVEENKDQLLLTHLRNEKNMLGHCSSCEHNSVCWGCRATAYYDKGDMFAPDPRCWINPDNLK